ncbi:MAG: EamA family transporter [Rouxiella aceris]|uniref:DMT family transporter n=1 Tax=Rouxiella aceris TaxID=2703884 RepID=UPI00285010B5|nr:EamA family transporter [Rouxiella aceris]MDR3430690.1 EamA family transporter [Rouxiella aceris]
MNALLYLAVILIWGTTWFAIYLQQGVVAASVSIFYRFLLASVLMMAVLVISGRLRKLALKDHLFCIAQGCCVFAFNFYCFYHAAAYISSGLESVIFSMSVLFNACNGWLWFRQKLSPTLLPASLLGLAGIITLFWHDLSATQIAPGLLTGIGLSLLGTYGFSLGNMISMRHKRQGLDVVSTNTYAMGYGAAIMALVSLLQGASFAMQWTPAYLGSLVYLAVFGSVLGFGIYFTLVGRIGASQAAYSTLLFPLVALTVSTFYEDYQWHIQSVIGLALILLGNLVMFSPPGWLTFWRKAPPMAS